MKLNLKSLALCAAMLSFGFAENDQNQYKLAESSSYYDSYVCNSSNLQSFVAHKYTQDKNGFYLDGKLYYNCNGFMYNGKEKYWYNPKYNLYASDYGYILKEKPKNQYEYVYYTTKQNDGTNAYYHVDGYTYDRPLTLALQGKKIEFKTISEDLGKSDKSTTTQAKIEQNEINKPDLESNELNLQYNDNVKSSNNSPKNVEKEMTPSDNNSIISNLRSETHTGYEIKECILGNGATVIKAKIFQGEPKIVFCELKQKNGNGFNYTSAYYDGEKWIALTLPSPKSIFNDVKSTEELKTQYDNRGDYVRDDTRSSYITKHIAYVYNSYIKM